MIRFKILILLISLSLFTNANADVVKKIIINGNERISKDTIVSFSGVQINDILNQNKINEITKDLYSTNFFDTISINFKDEVLSINVVELPIIETINYTGVKSDSMKKILFSNLKLKSRSSFNKALLKNDIESINQSLKQLGYYFSEIEVSTTLLSNNIIELTYNIQLGNKAKIKKITFLGDKIFKDRKLKSLIVSEEYKFWKFISGKKFLNEDIIKLDERLLKNFYLNKGYYNVEIKSSFAKMINDEDFELVYNIIPNNKIFFGDIKISLPSDFSEENYSNLYNLFSKLKGNNYSLIKVNDILEEIDKLTLNEEFQSITASVKETFDGDKINLNFVINETEKLIVERINIFGNNITQENVIRNQFEMDEGDIYNEILLKRTENNLKSLNFFKKVDSNVIDGSNNKSKIINYTVEEKPTGEIAAGAGVGTRGGTAMFGVTENNYLGRGVSLDAEITVNKESIKGRFKVKNPNFRNSDKSVYGSLLSEETDRLKQSGYKSGKTGFSYGTNFEFLDDVNIGLGNSFFYEDIETDSTASTQQKAQAGDYFDSFINLDFTYDKRNQRFQTSDGFLSSFSTDIPLVSESNTFTNSYNYSLYKELFDNNVSNFSFYFKTANSITGDDIKLSERLYVPGSKLRGFEVGKIGPKDGDDYIGGNFVSSINFSSTLPTILENVQQMDMLIFFDAANVWGVDYSSSLSDNSKIRSSIGIGVDWFTVIGPLSFSLAHPLSKLSTDTTESFRFNLGTTF